ncbi:unnamed protein product [Brachionus calyciflorus]|uniref:Uncharacterized protein n=1 Tax=Brachionus calyciflorus TaxID=104777 RepID=A0A813RCS8_9BILA|nr:unnamed protein product [Brachionus calyciflorus]
MFSSTSSDKITYFAYWFIYLDEGYLDQPNISLLMGVFVSFWLTEEESFNLFQNFKIIQNQKNVEDIDAIIDSNSCDSKKSDKSNTENSNKSAKVNKRKHKSENFGNEDGWWKRRSLRKGNEKNEQTEITINDILKKFFDDNMLSDVKTIMTPTKKKFLNQNLSTSIQPLEENESEPVEKFIEKLKSCETNMFELIKKYLNELSLNFDKKWYESLDEIFIKLFDYLNNQMNLTELISSERNHENFLSFAPIIICYYDLKFSKYKLEIESRNSNEEDLNISFEPRDLKMEKLIYDLQEFENVSEEYFDYELFNENCQNERISNVFQSLLLRIYSLNLFVSCNFQYLDISIEYYNEKLLKQLDNKNVSYFNGISKIFKTITRDGIREFLKQNKKNNIFKLGGRIEKFFMEANYESVIANLEDFAEINKLPIDNSKFNPKTFIYFLKSYLNLSRPDITKCTYFCRKFLKDCVHFLKEQIKSLFSLNGLDKVTNSESDEAINVDNDAKIGFLNEVTILLCDILDILFQIMNNPQKEMKIDENLDFDEEIEQKNTILKETLWLMNQIVSIYFDSSNDLALKLDIKIKPLKAFMILFDITEKNSDLKENISEFLISVHEYLARNGFCGCNNGEFLNWAIEKSIKFKLECEICSMKKVSSADKDQTDEDSNKSAKSATKSTDSDNICCCQEYDEILEQLFFCLFGFKKKSARHLKNHSRITQSYDANNCWNLYFSYKPNKFPEYDDLQKYSLTTEIYDLFTDILRLIQKDYEDENEKCRDEFINALESLDFNLIDSALSDLSTKYTKENELKFKDIFYYLADFNFKIEKDQKKKDLLINTYYIKDLIYNKERFDSWTAFGLYRSTEVLEQYLENSQSIKTETNLEKFINSVNLSINLFKKALQYKRENDHTVLLEFGLFLYQINSFCSRLLRMNRLIGYFETDEIKKEIERNQKVYLGLCYDAYKQVYTSNNQSSQGTDSNKPKPCEKLPITNIDESSATSSSSEKNSDSRKLKTQISQNFDDFNDEEWLQNYMLGKIKEKQKSNVLECLEHYKQAYESLDKGVTAYLKKITYKTKSCLNLEANEMFYRIYSLTLKRLEELAFKSNNENELTQVSNFLETLVETRFVRSHNDFDLDEISVFLQENIFSNSIKLNEIEHKDLFLNCVCICVTGLCQILKRFSQHYRSIYRLAHFYTKFLDFKNLEISKNLLLGNPKWNSFVYMPCPGLFQERNKTNFYNGIWKISSNTKEEQQDFERAGSFSNHLFKSTLLLVEVLEKTNDRANLLEISRIFFQKLDPEKKYLNDDSLRDYIANKSLSSSYKVVEKAALESLKKTFNDMNEFYAYQNDLVPLLIDSYEVYKLASKNNEKITKFCENNLTKLYIQFNPEALSRSTPISMDEIIKFCLMMDRKEKINKPKAKPRHSLGQPPQPTQSTNPLNLSNVI